MGLQKDLHLSAGQYYNSVMIFCTLILSRSQSFATQNTNERQMQDIW